MSLDLNDVEAVLEYLSDKIVVRGGRHYLPVDDFRALKAEAKKVKEEEKEAPAPKTMEEAKVLASKDPSVIAAFKRDDSPTAIEGVKA